MIYVIYNNTGNILRIASEQSQVFIYDNEYLLEVEQLPEWVNDPTKRAIVQNNQLVEDPNFVYKTPEELRLENTKKQKFDEIVQEFSKQFMYGHFYSQALQMEVDYRRGNYNNDLQNVESLIQIMQLTSTGEVVFKGYTEEKLATLEQLQQLTIEMKQRGLWLYQRKWTIEEYVKQATKVSTVKAIPIDFESEDYNVGNAFELPEEEMLFL